MPLQITPTIFIGLGGTGCKVVTNLQNILHEKGTEFFRYAQFLKVDTMVRPERGVTSLRGDYISLATPGKLGSEMVGTLLSNEDCQQFFKSWWHRDQNGNWERPAIPFQAGAGQIRRYGRLIFNYHSATRSVYGGKDLKTILRDRLDYYTLSIANPPMQVDPASLQSLDVILFAGAAGGSGSSLLVDMGYLVRSIFGDILNTLTAVVFQEDIVTDKAASIEPTLVRNMKKNKIRCLAELEFWQQQLVYSHKGEMPQYEAIWNATAPDKTEFPDQIPFNSITVVGGQNDWNIRLPEIEDYYDFVAHYFGYIYGGTNTEFWRESINILGNMIVDEEQSKPTEARRYARIGMLRIRFPMEEIKKYMVNKLIAEALERGFNHRHSLTGKGVEDAILETWDVSELRNIENISTLEVDGKHPVKKHRMVDNDIFDGIKNLEEFRNQFQQTKQSLDGYYESLRSDSFVQRWMNVTRKTKKGERIICFDELVWSTMRSFADINVKENVSVKNMWWYLKGLMDNVGQLQKQNNAFLGKIIITLRNHEKKLTEAKWDEWAKNFKKLFGKGKFAKEEAVTWSNTYSHLTFEKMLYEGRQLLLKRAFVFLENLYRNINILAESANELLETCLRESSSSMVGIPEYTGVERNLINKLDDLAKYRPEWFDGKEINKRSRVIFRSLISGKYDKDTDLIYSGPGNTPTEAKGVIAYLHELQKMGDADRQARLDDKLEEFLFELKSMGERAFWESTGYANEIGQLSAWNYIVESVAPDSPDATSLADNILRLFEIYRNQAAPFGKINTRTAGEYRQLCSQRVYIEHNRESARNALGNRLGDELFEDFLHSIFSPPNKDPLIDANNPNCDPSEIIISAVLVGYPLRVFEGFEGVEDILEDPGFSSNWVDSRFSGWLKQRKRILDKMKRPTIDLAICGLAFAWRDDGKQSPSSGLTWKRKSGKDIFEFSKTQDRFHDILDLFQKLPDSPIYETIKTNLDQVWQRVPPGERISRLEEAANFLASQASKRKQPRSGRLREASKAVLELVDSVDSISFQNG